METQFQFISAAPAVEPVIEGVWQVSAPAGSPVDVIAPDGCPELVVHLDGSVERSLRGRPIDCSPVALVQTTSGALSLKSIGHICVRAIRFRPTGLFQLGADVRGFRDVAVDPAQLLGPLGDRLVDALASAAQLDIALARVQSLICDGLQQSHRNVTFNERALAQLSAASGERTLEALTGWTARHTRRLMVAETGMTPSELKRMAQFQRARDLIVNTRSTLSDIAAATHYVDQAHLSRRVKQFSGMTPGQLRNAGGAYSDLYALSET